MSSEEAKKVFMRLSTIHGKTSVTTRDVLPVVSANNSEQERLSHERELWEMQYKFLDSLTDD